MLDQKEADDFRNAVVEDLHNYVEISIEAFFDLSDEETFRVVVCGGCFLSGEGSTERSSSRAERYLLSLVKTVPI